MARKHQGRKRRQPSSTVAGSGGGGFVATIGMGEMMMDGEVEMDDLAVAASYAALVYTSPPVVPSEKSTISVDDNEISLMDDDDDGSQNTRSNQAVDRETDNQQKTPKSDSLTTVDSDSSSDSDNDSEHEDDDVNKSDVNDDDDDEDDNDSGIDFEKEHRKLEQMERKNQVDDTEDGKESLAAPKTENELDPYRTPLCELEKKFQLKLTVEENEKLRLCTAKTVVDNHQTNNNDQSNIKLCLAGKIKTHMVQDRTVIVESCGPAGDGSFTAPLDEGSLLVFEMDDSVENPMTDDTKSDGTMSTGVVTTTTTTTSTNRRTLIPLGKIFEVFGPVRRPLYAVRLPARDTKTNSKKSKATKSLEVSTNSASGKGDDNGAASPKSLQTETNSPLIDTQNAESLRNESPSEDTKSKEMSKEGALTNLDPEPSYTPQLPQETDEVSSIDAKIPELLDDKKEPGRDSELAAKESSRINDDMVDEKLEKINRKEAVVDEVSNIDVSQMSDSNEAPENGEGPNSTKDTPAENSTQSHRVDTDPWSSQGKYTAFLDKRRELSIFYVQDSAKIIDAEAILRMSARGCDASNIFDEEVDNVNEMYFSDDEEERQLKSKSRNKNRGKEDATKFEQDTSRKHYEPRHKQLRGGKSRSFQQAPPVPTGFHQHPQQFTQVGPHAYQTQPIYQAPHFYVPGGAPPPPPPPPPPGGPSRGTYNHNHAPATAGGYMVPQPGYAQAHVYPYPPTHAPYGAYHQQQQQHPYPHGYQQPYAHPSYAPQQQQQHHQQHPPQQNQSPTQQQQSDTVYYDYS